MVAKLKTQCHGLKHNRYLQQNRTHEGNSYDMLVNLTTTFLADNLNK